MGKPLTRPVAIAEVAKERGKIPGLKKKKKEVSVGGINQGADGRDAINCGKGVPRCRKA